VTAAATVSRPAAGRGRMVSVAISRAERREGRRERVVATVGRDHADAALDLLELLELAWHDCYGDVSPSEDIVDDVLLVSRGRLDQLIHAARLAVTDWRDLKVAAERRRSET